MDRCTQESCPCWTGQGCACELFDMHPNGAPRHPRGPAVSDTPPPVAKYRLTLTITGNSHDEIEKELMFYVRGGYLLNSGYYERDEFTVYGGRRTAVLEHTNPEQTPERYDAELTEWSEARKAARREATR